jgi:queuine tRNA-ribosyltransferase
MELTHRWLARCVQHMSITEPKYGYEQSLFPIVQGSTYKDLRKQSAEFIASMECDGNAIGGLSVGEPEEHLYEMTDLVCSILPKEKPRYLMGVGTPANILECISLGIDMFDCVMPSRNARHGLLFTWKGTINIKNEKWAKDFSPIDDSSLLWADQVYTKAYLRHLIKTQEYLGVQVATLHNLTFYLQLVKEARKQIIAGSFESWKNSLIPILKQRL